ncbi:MAG: hypothetical protein GY753_11935 [Gammaproteobacteria bacterium]|nr:hypothetical protein [Gammaproteobacteria bacterium]
MPDTIYNWGREKKVINRHTRKKVKVPVQSIITETGLKPTRIPVYHEPEKISVLSRGFMDYDPLGNA